MGLRYEIVCEKWSDAADDYVTEPFPVVFGSRNEAEAMADKYRTGQIVDHSFFPLGASLDVFEMILKRGELVRTGA